MKSYYTESKVETYFISRLKNQEYDGQLQRIPILVTDNYIELGQLTALRFLEWVALNPEGVIALPTGKTPEFFIKWVQYYLENWQNEMDRGILKKIGLDPKLNPEMKSLHFFQIDEFFPMDPKHERSFNYFINKFYIDGFGLNPKKVRLIDTFSIPESLRPHMEHYKNVYETFGESKIDLSLRSKQPKNNNETCSQNIIKYFDAFCQAYEDEIRSIGGIGFFLGGIGPDGHIAFNIKGTDHHSHTRLTTLNYETQAAAATDLGGIELVKKKAVITIGLETITYNPDTVAIIIASGEAKSKLIADAAEKTPSIEYPASVLQKLKNSRFYITRSASVSLKKIQENYVRLSNNEKVQKKLAEELFIQSAINARLTLKETATISEQEVVMRMPEFPIIAELSNMTMKQLSANTYDNLNLKILRGLDVPKNQKFLHTGPHHDDIELAYFPYLHHLVRRADNDNYFVYCTSGFTSVADNYVLECLDNLHNHIQSGIIQKISNHADQSIADDDITGYLKGIASQNKELQHLYISSRLARNLFKFKNLKKLEDLSELVAELIKLLKSIEAGRKEPEIIQSIKGCLREFEAELVWAHFGIGLDHIFHLHLPFYTDDIFPEYPDFKSDVQPILSLLEKVQPDVISLALDPEGSGPDTHYKTLIAMAEAIDKYRQQHPDIQLKIWAYRNVWSRYKLTDINYIIPVSLNSFGVLYSMFNNCFISQRSASFPSYELNGTFSQLAQKIWVEQHNDLTTLLGKEYFYDSKDPMLRRAFGAIYLKVMTLDEFEKEIIPLKRLLHAKDELKK